MEIHGSGLRCETTEQGLTISGPRGAKAVSGTLLLTHFISFMQTIASIYSFAHTAFLGRVTMLVQFLGIRRALRMASVSDCWDVCCPVIFGSDSVVVPSAPVI
jgi:hypothetical protein